MLITREYRELNRKLHVERADYGTVGQRWASYVEGLIATEGHASVLDYGAGKMTLAKALPDRVITNYDPCIACLDAEPEPHDLVVCTDVLEHIEPVHLNAVLRHMAAMTRRKLFFNVALTPSSKVLADGRNTHLIIKPADWWRARLKEHFRLVLWKEHGGGVFGEALPGKASAVLTERQAIRPEIHQMISQIKEQNERYSDAWGRIRSFNVWQGVGDQAADMQIVMGLLSAVPDVDAEMVRIVKMAQKSVLVFAALTQDHPEEYWRRVLESYLRVADWHIDVLSGERRLVCSGAPMVGVSGVRAVGAMDSDERWEQVKGNAERIRARIRPAEAHDRLAVIACYGPSLSSTVEAIREETDADVVSVSGSHDFLIERGIVPKYHVECDPRPHKTQNMDAAHPGVIYLIASAVHPNYFDKLEGHDVRLWHISTHEHALRIVDELGESARFMISGGGSVGLRAIPLLYAMGYRRFHIHGMDCSFSVADDGDTVLQWAGKHAGKRQDICEVACGERRFISSPILLTYATGFFETVQAARDIEIRLYGDGLLQAMAAENNAKDAPS